MKVKMVMEAHMKLEKDLYAIDKTLLVKAGENISRKTLDTIAGLPKTIRYKQIKDTSLMKDLIQTFKDKRYVNIFYPPEINQKIIRSINKMKIPEKILSELAFIKKLSPYTYHHILIIAVLAAKIS
ncbi:MAG: hypothetical protein LLG40_04950, partial [Deltaproteobacteria bacterium]|nr:hypothetical protein [Deltaproteobacteria bacterium]